MRFPGKHFSTQQLKIVWDSTEELKIVVWPDLAQKAWRTLQLSPGQGAIRVAGQIDNQSQTTEIIGIPKI